MVVEIERASQNDNVASFILGETIRGRVARVDESLNNILSQHSYPPKVSALMAEAILLAIMIGQSIKLKWKLSLQVRGSKAIKLIAVDYFSPRDHGNSAEIRAYAKFDDCELKKPTDSAFQCLGKGFFAVLIDQGSGTEPYQGITPLTGNSLSSCAETYFFQSEQLPTSFKIVVGQSGTSGLGLRWIGGGLMLQQLPGSDDVKFKNADLSSERNSNQTNVVDEMVISDYENWSRANMLMNTVEELELVGPELTFQEVLRRLFYQEYLLVWDSIPLRFGCTCSAEKVARTLSIYSQKDIKSMTTEDGTVTADCQFCGQHYILEPNQLGFESEV